jgi:hypothetical protein
MPTLPNLTQWIRDRCIVVSEYLGGKNCSSSRWRVCFCGNNDHGPKVLWNNPFGGNVQLKAHEAGWYCRISTDEVEVTQIDPCPPDASLDTALAITYLWIETRLTPQRAGGRLVVPIQGGRPTETVTSQCVRLFLDTPTHVDILLNVLECRTAARLVRAEIMTRTTRLEVQ